MMNKDRIFFYCTAVPLAIMNCVLLAAHHQHQKDLEEVSESCNRQIELIWKDRLHHIDRLEKKYVDKISKERQ